MDFCRERDSAIENVANLQPRNSESLVNKDSDPVPVNQESLETTKDLNESSEPREVYQIPVAMFNDVIKPGSRSMHHCRRYLTEEGCPFGEECVYSHGEASPERPSEVICLLPGTDAGDNGGRSSKMNDSNYRTRPCWNWERSRYCPYGTKCCFIHRVAETEDCNNNGGPVNQDLGDRSVHANKAYGPSQRLHNVAQNHAIEKPTRKWKGPNKISKVYGDWIDDFSEE